MPTAKFIADFTTFQTAVKQAEASLVDFSKGASTVERSLARMTDSFSGRAVIQQAELTARAVSDIGGASRLTESELRRVASTTGEAVAKLKAMGMEVPPGIAKLADETKNAAAAAGGFGAKLQTVNGLLGGLGIGLSVGAVVNFGKALLDDADALTKMSARSGETVRVLQQMQIAGDDAGNTVEEMTAATNQLQNRLASGDSSAVKAIQRLNIDLTQLQKLSPGRQFMELSDALREVKNPADQVALAMDLFGKTGVNVLPTLKRGFDDVRDSAVGMSEDTVKALDDAGDALAKWWRQGKGIAAEATVGFARLASAGFNPMLYSMREAAREAQAFNDQLADLVKNASGPKLAGADVPTSFPMPSESEIAAFTKEIDEAVRKNADLAKAVEEGRQQWNAIAQTARGYRAIVADLNGDTVEAIRWYTEQGVELNDVARAYGLTAVQARALGEQFKVDELRAKALAAELSIERGVGKALVGMNEAAAPLIARTLPDLAGKLNVVSQSSVLAKATSEGFFGKMKDFVKGGLSDVKTGLFEGFGNLLSGGITSVVNMGLGLISKGVKGLFNSLTGNTEEKKVNPIRQAYVDAAGGLAVLNQRAAEAGVTVRELLNARTVEQYQRAIQNLNDAFEFQANAMKTLDDTTKKYGFTLEELGPALQRSTLDKQAQELFKDFQVLTSAGIDVQFVIGRMGDSIQAFVNDALKTGTEIPSAMRPMLESMVSMGKLTDENGNVITDLEGSGIRFAETMTEGFTRIVDEVKKLTDAITRGLGLAITNIPQPEVTGRVRWEVDPVPGGGGDGFNDFPVQPDPIPMASGGSGRVTGPTLFYSGGNERFWFSGEGSEKVPPPGAESLEELRGEVVALRQQQAELNAFFRGSFSDTLARAMRDERQKVTRR